MFVVTVHFPALVMVVGQAEMVPAAWAAGEIAPMPSSSKAARASAVFMIMIVLPLPMGISRPSVSRIVPRRRRHNLEIVAQLTL
jgi:hypothetical protein